MTSEAPGGECPQPDGHSTDARARLIGVQHGALTDRMANRLIVFGEEPRETSPGLLSKNLY